VDHTSTLTGLQRALNGSRTASGLDVVFTKLAVDLQTLTEDSIAESITDCLAVMQESTGCDSVCLAVFGEDAQTIAKVYSAQATFTSCNPDQLTDESLEDWPWLTGQLTHLRLIEMLDTEKPPAGAAADAERLRKLNIASVLLAGLTVNGRLAGFLAFMHGQPAEEWDADNKLLLKLLGSSLASGLEKIEIQNEVAERNELRDLVVGTAHDGMWDFDARENLIRFSDQWKAMMGYTDAELAKARPDWRKLIHEDDLARVQAGLREHIAGNSEVFTSVHRMRRRDGEWRWMDCRVKALTDGNGRLRRLVGNEYDITERKVYEEALFREKESAQITLQSIGDGVITTDEENRVEYLNPLAQELTGWRVEDAIGRRLD
jgi:PAS domain S-box-containing protein